MRYSEETIDRVRSGNDIVDVIGSCVQLKKKGASYFGICPFHNEKTPSFSVSPQKQIYYCFGCGAGGDVVSFLMEYENMSFPEALKSLADRAGITLPQRTESEEQGEAKRERERILSLLKDAATFYYNNLRSPEGKDGLDYFRKRGLGAQVLQSFGLGYAGKKNGVCDHLKEKGYSDEEINKAGLVYVNEKQGIRDRFFNRVIFPIMDPLNHVIGFGGRVLGNGEPKYLNSPETTVFNKGRQFYGLNIARKTRKKYFIICEGYMDVISMHEAGFTEAVATLGTAFTEEHAGVIRKFRKEARLIYDSDSAGEKAALRALPILKKAGIPSRVVNLKPCKDPDEFIRKMGAEEFEKRVENAENAFFFEIHALEKEYDLKDPEGRTKFQQSLAKRLAGIEDEIERNNYTEALASEYMIKDELLKRAVEGFVLTGISHDETAADDPAGDVSYTAVRQKRIKETGGTGAQKYLLTIIGDDPDRVYPAVKPYIEPEDFTPGIMRMTAESLFGQLDSGIFNIAGIVGRFEDPTERREVAEIFNTTLDQDLSNTERENALTDLVIRIKRESFKRRDEENEFGEDLISRSIKEKKLLEKLETIRIKLR